MTAAHKGLSITMERRSGNERRLKTVPVEVERRSGEDRRKAEGDAPPILSFMCRQHRDAFAEWIQEYGATDRVRLISDKKNIRHCQWELWSILLDYDLKNIDLARDIYLIPEQRDEVFQEVVEKGYARRIVHITRADGRVVDLDIVYCQEGAVFSTYVKFLKVR